MAIFGYLGVGFAFVALGLVDWVLGLNGIDLYRALGMTLPEDVGKYSAILAIGLGAMVIVLAESKVVAQDIEELMEPGEELIFCRRVRLRPGRFGPAKSGFLFLSSRRIGYRGDLPKAYKYLQDGSMGSDGFVWDLKDLTQVEREGMTLRLISGERDFKLRAKGWTLNAIIRDIKHQRHGQV